MSPNGKRIWGAFVTRLLKAIQKSLKGRPPEEVEAFGRRFGAGLFYVAGSRRKTAITNLAYAFPRYSLAQRTKLAKRSFQHFGRVSADFLVGLDRTKSEIEESSTIVGVHHLDEAVARGKGVLLITGHFGHWERASAWMSLAGYKLNVITRDADDEGINALINRLRSGPGTAVIPRGDAARPILEKLKAKEIVGILPDQNNDDIFLPFFGKIAGCNLGPGVIQNRTQAAVLPVYCAALDEGRYKIVFCPILEPLPGFEAKGEGLTRAINAWLEGVIRLYPEQWLWLHDRWRSARQRGDL